jgi:dihydroorotase
MDHRTLIRNATLVNEGRVEEGDLLIRSGRIERIDAEIGAPAGCEVRDAAGCLLLPGMIDDQVHFREPGLTHKGDIGSESRAAVAGGVTSFMDMPNTRPPTTTRAELDNKLAIAARTAAANYGFFFGATNDNIQEVRALDRNMTCGLKVFMGASTGNMLVDREETLEQIFRDSPVLIATHCESTPMIQANLEQALQRYGEEIPVAEHARIRSADACLASSRLAVDLARRHDAQLHILHITTAAELELFEPGPMAGKSITAETCVHFLHFTEADYASLGNRIKCNPAIKTAEDRAALREALTSGRIDILATDHAPHTAAEKADPSYLRAPAGLPLVQDVLLASLELVHEGDLELPRLVEKIAHNPALRFGVRDRGFLREGYWADLVLVDPMAETLVSPQRVLSRCGWSPFEGRSFHSRILATWVNGALAWDGERLLEHGAAMPLEYQRP